MPLLKAWPRALLSSGCRFTWTLADANTLLSPVPGADADAAGDEGKKVVAGGEGRQLITSASPHAGNCRKAAAARLVISFHVRQNQSSDLVSPASVEGGQQTPGMLPGRVHCC